MESQFSESINYYFIWQSTMWLISCSIYTMQFVVEKNVLSWPWEDIVICVTPVSTILQLPVYIDFEYCFVCHLTLRKMSVVSFLGNQGSGSLWFSWSCYNQTSNLKIWPYLALLSPSALFFSAAHLHSALINWWCSCMEALSLDKNCSGWKEPVRFVTGVV